MCLQKYLYKGKIRLKIEHFLMEIGLNKPSFYQDIDIFFNFRCRIISVKLLLFGVNILLDTNTKILMITELRN